MNNIAVLEAGCVSFFGIEVNNAFSAFAHTDESVLEHHASFAFGLQRYEHVGRKTVVFDNFVSDVDVRISGLTVEKDSEE